MSNYIAKGEDLTSVADAIRSKSGGSEALIFPNEFVSAIGELPSNAYSNAYVGATASSATSITFSDVEHEPRIALITVNTQANTGEPRMSVSRTNMTVYLLCYKEPNHTSWLARQITVTGSFSSAPYQTTIQNSGIVSAPTLTVTYDETNKTFSVTHTGAKFATGGRYYLLHYFY